MNPELNQRAASAEARATEPLPEWLKVFRSQVESLKYGTVQVTVHDSKVLQIERLERMRLDRPQ